MVLCMLKYLLSFQYAYCGTMYGLCVTNSINIDGLIDQEIIVNGVFHLLGIGPPKVLLEVLSFVQFFNFSFIEKSLLLGTVQRK